MPILRCLFCNHINSAEASFCNACGSQLDLQPCGQCGAVDSRTAKSCHKCAAPFMPHAAAESDAVLASVTHGDPWDHSSRIEASVAGVKAMTHAHDQARSSNYSLLTVGPAAADGLGQTARASSGWLVPGIALLALALAASFAIFHQRPVETVPMQAAAQVAPHVVETPAAPPPPPAPALAPALAAQADPVAVAMPAQKPPVAPAILTEVPAKMPARAAPRTAPKLAAPPLPVTDTLPTAHREPPVIKNCSQAVATLGLCNP